MTEDTKVKIRRKPRPKYDPRNKEQASEGNKNKRRRRRHKKPKKDLGQSLKELQKHFHRNYKSDYTEP